MHVARIAVCAALAVYASCAEAQSSCLASDSVALRVRAFARAFVADPTPTGALFRSRSPFTTTTDTTKVVVLTTAATCVKVAAAYNAHFQTPAAVRRLYVIDVNGKGFFVYEPQTVPPRSSSYQTVWSMTKQYAFSGGFNAW
jgi:hypothetical protein